MVQIGMIGLGRMRANMVRRPLGRNHECVVFDHSSRAVKDLAEEGAIKAVSLEDLIKKLDAPPHRLLASIEGLVQIRSFSSPLSSILLFSRAS
ncbi:MAG: NAD(P)-binding domain-containing protein [Desulfosalsimonas sp.]